MIEIKSISKEKFDEVYLNHQYQYFIHSSDFSLRRKANNWDSDFLGFFENQQLVGAMVLAGRSAFLGRKRYEINSGPLLNYENLNQTQACFEALSEYLISIKALSCEMSPNITINLYNDEKTQLVDKNLYMQVLENLGWVYDQESDKELSKIRWFFKKDLKAFNTYKDLSDSYDRETKRLIKNAKDFPLKIVELGKDNLERAVNILETTAERRGFDTRDLNYHKSLFKYLNQKDEVKYLVVELNVEEYLNILDKEAEDLKQAIKDDSDNTSKRAQNRINQNKDQLLAREKRIGQLKEINLAKIDISAGVFIGVGNTMTYLFGGSKKSYLRYNGAYLLQDYIINYALENNYDVYDFYGTLTKLSGHPEQEGVYNFKKGFGGQLYENLGFFEFKPKSFFNSFFEKIVKIKHAISK